MAAGRLLVALLFVSAPFLATSAETKSTCKLALTALAVISCQERQQFPTPSCCDALLYAVDMGPELEPERGLCCLCRFATTRELPFDIYSVYRICGGKDASLVGEWPVPTPLRGDCSGPCHEHAPAPPAPSGRSDEDKKAEPKSTLGSSAIVGIVVGAIGAVVVSVFLACCLYNKGRGGGKARESPHPSDDESSRVEMTDRARISSSRNLL